jgi:hydroxymethylpyrimidine pyrophosphatase-like HAD family hydrolase
MPRSPFRLLALDVDGTLLDPSGTLRPATSAAVARAAAAGIRPVLCTGRRYRRALPVAVQLGLDAPLVCNSGALVKDPGDHRTLWRADLDGPSLDAVMALFLARDEPAVSFTDRDPSGRDFLVAAWPTGRPLFDEYVELNADHAEVDPTWTARAGQPGSSHFHVCAIGERPTMLDLQAEVHRAIGGRVRTFVQKSPRYTGWMCEVLRHDASKWSAVLHLADLWGIAPSEICAVGDDMNDVPMLEGAGLGIAMGHAPPEVLAAADLVTGDHDVDGLAAVIDGVLLADSGT